MKGWLIHDLGCCGLEQVHAEQTLEAVNQTRTATANANETDGELNATWTIEQKTLEQLQGFKSKIEEMQKLQRKGESDLAHHELKHDATDREGSDVDKENDEDPEARKKYIFSSVLAILLDCIIAFMSRMASKLRKFPLVLLKLGHLD